MKIFFKMPLAVFFVIVFIGINSFTKNYDLEGFKAVHINSTWEFPRQTGDHLTFTRSPDIIFSKTYEIVREPYLITNTYVTLNNLGQEVPDKKRPATSETAYRYCICKRGEKYGVCYKSISDSIGKTYPLDSLINDFLHFPSVFYNARGKSKDSLRVVRDDKNGFLTEIITNKRLSETDPDSSCFYFRKKPLDYSFLVKDKRTDNMYLYKAVILFNHIPKVDNINHVPEEQTKYQHSFELTEIEIPDKENIKRLIDKFKRSSGGVTK